MRPHAPVAVRGGLQRQRIHHATDARVSRRIRQVPGLDPARPRRRRVGSRIAIKQRDQTQARPRGQTEKNDDSSDVNADPGKALVAPTKRKGSSDYLRKGQWTPTEERLARLLIEAFEEGYLPIYTGIRLRGYLAVQLQCDPMRVSKKLCAGSIDGKQIPKNYGQRKFRLRKKQLWDREEAGRIINTLERLTRELWNETAIAMPANLTLSSTRNAEDDEVELLGAAMPVKKLSPPANKSKKQKDGVVFPIIYLNLSKKAKQNSHGNMASPSDSSPPGSTIHSPTPRTEQSSQDGDAYVYARPSAEYSSSNDSDDPSSNTTERTLRVDGESLLAAYELLNLHQHRTFFSSSTLASSRPMEDPYHPPERRDTSATVYHVVPILPAPSNASIRHR
ncbi:hypothetical protein PINS_up017403 [Pythium insidiosum]|nr:hypothetical protein PINS_up017403 [Pythium insidiosum]